jgi:hypothetical protein
LESPVPLPDKSSLPLVASPVFVEYILYLQFVVILHFSRDEAALAFCEDLSGMLQIHFHHLL